MAAPAPSTTDILTSALRKLGAIGAAEPISGSEMTEFALSEFNGIVEQLNLRERNCYFSRVQEFTYATTKQTYSVGTAANVADFQVTDGDAPVRLKNARHVLIAALPNPVYIPMAVLDTIEQYQQLAVPALQSLYPQLCFYERTVANGSLSVYPVPTQTSDKIELTWWNQLDTVAIADVATALVLPQGFRRGLATKLALAMWPAYAKRTDLEELKRQDREVWADIQSPNVSPPKISTTDGVGAGAGTFDFRSRQWV